MTRPTVKCVVWDLDNTLWAGTLLEDDTVTLREGVLETLKELDRRGILNSIASKNNYSDTMDRLRELDLDRYFLFPQIGWNPKSSSIRAIAGALNIATDTFCFVDDQPFEREEVMHELPEVLCLHAQSLRTLLQHPRLQPRFITAESSGRRQLYLSDIRRNEAAAEFCGNNESFLATLEMVFEIKEAAESDLQRAHELTVRTHQLNTTGITYDYDELDHFRRSPDYLLLVARLTDRFGPYGTIGLCLVETGASYWTVKLLLMSCRVMSRGVGTVLLTRVMHRARETGKPLRAEFVPNGKNRMMHVTYRFGGFREIDKVGDCIILENTLEHIQPPPPYVNVRFGD